MLTYPEELAFIKNANAPQKKSDEKLTGKVCVVTGATSGVGLETIKQLAKGQAHLVMACRNVKKAQAIQAELVAKHQIKVDIVKADFSSLDDVRHAAHVILKTYPNIYALVNNAGMYATKKTYTEDGFETVFCVNHLAPFLFTALLLPRLKQSAPARIIQVNSQGHRFNGLDLNDLHWKRRIYTGLRGYGASKTAQLLTTWEFAKLLKKSGVTINAMHPGEVKTNIGQNNGWLYRFFFRHVTCHFLKNPCVSGESIYYLLAEPTLSTVSGQFYNLTVPEIPAKHARNREAGQQMFELSLMLTGLD